MDAKEKVEAMLKLHAQVRARIEKVNQRYKVLANKNWKHVYKESDLVWLHLRKESFPNICKNKLMLRLEGPFKVIEKVNDSAYKLEFPGDYEVSATFNIGDLVPYLHDEEDA